MLLCLAMLIPFHKGCHHRWPAQKRLVVAICSVVLDLHIIVLSIISVLADALGFFLGRGGLGTGVMVSMDFTRCSCFRVKGGDLLVVVVLNLHILVVTIVGVVLDSALFLLGFGFALAENQVSKLS